MKANYSARPFVRGLVSLLAAAALYGFSETNVFDMPERSRTHNQLLAMMDGSHKEGNYALMEAACRRGLELGTADELWSYNLACALALQGNSDKALEALDRAISMGFADVEHLKLDPDLASIRSSEGFQKRLGQFGKRTGKPPPARVLPMRPDSRMTVMQTSTNTEWSFQMGIFHTFVALPPPPPSQTYRGPEANALRTWLREGTASGCAGVIYANRDSNAMPIDIARYPGLLRLAYSQDMVDRRLNIGMPNTLFANEAGNALVPVVGHSSMGYMNSPFWRSQPRALNGDPQQLSLQAVFLLGNQLFFYPAFADYDLSTGDLFPANTPYGFAVAGSNNAEQPFVEAALAALAALRPETHAELSRTGLLMPALHMLFRASQRTVKSRADYLTGIAHPPAFQPANLDPARLVLMAHALTTNDLPPLVILNVTQETQMIPDRDFFDAVRTERLFDSPVSIARVFRGAPRTRTLNVQARCKRADARLHWVVLQGDTSKVTFTPCPTNSSVMSVTVAHHEPFDAPVGNGKKIPTSRVDIGVIAETAAGFSLPSVISFAFLGNERRTYSDDGRILSIDYTRRRGGYSDPLLSHTRNWKDCYRYDAQGALTGWTRIRGLDEERFTAYGHKIVATDALGRAARAHIVRYLPRHIKTDAASPKSTDLAQLDDNLEVAYRYRSDSDLIGAPDYSAVKQALDPLASAP